MCSSDLKPNGQFVRNVTDKLSAALYPGPSVHFALLVLVNSILLLTRPCLAQFDSILHFCNFSERHGQILHYRHIFVVQAILTV